MHWGNWVNAISKTKNVQMSIVKIWQNYLINILSNIFHMDDIIAENYEPFYYIS
mgnify:CR=1 FL=1